MLGTCGCKILGTCGYRAFGSCGYRALGSYRCTSLGTYDINKATVCFLKVHPLKLTFQDDKHFSFFQWNLGTNRSFCLFEYIPGQKSPQLFTDEKPGSIHACT